MSRDVAQDALDAARLLSGFLRETDKRLVAGEPITQQEVDQRKRQVAAFKEARPGLSVTIVAQLDEAVAGIVQAFAVQEGRRRTS